MKFDLSRVMILRGFDAKAFARRYDLEPFAAPCGGCGKLVETTLPWATRDFRGLMGDCECGHRGAPYCEVAAKGDLLDGFDSVRK